MFVFDADTLKYLVQEIKEKCMSQTNGEINGGANINDDTIDSTTTWSSEKINNLLNNYVTKEYVDDNIPIRVAPVSNMNVTGATVVINDIPTSGFYALPKRTDGTLWTNLRFQLKANDGTTINALLGGYQHFPFEVNRETRKIYIDNLRITYTIGDTAETTSIVIEPYFLHTNNTKEYTPTTDYHPATKKYVDDSIANIQVSDESGNVDLSNYALKSELHEHSNKSVIDTITNDMFNKWNQALPFNDTYVSDCNTWLTNGYVKTGASQTANLPSLCTGSDRWGILFFIAENVTQGTGTQMYFPIDGTYKGRIFTRSLTNMNQTPTVGEWNLLSTFSGNYNDLTNKPTIPSIEGLATEEFVNNAIDNISEGFSGDYNDLTNKPEIPSIEGLATEEYVNNNKFSGNYNDLTNKPTIPTVPTNISAFTNDKGYLTSIPTEYVTDSELTAKKYATESFVQTAIDNAQISGEGSETVDMSKYALKTDIPTATSQLTNDSNFITSIPSEYITETELTAKGYLTEHLDISGKADKSELHAHTNKTVLDGITTSKVTEWDNKSTFSGNYNDLTNKPTIPSIEGLASEEYVEEKLDEIHSHDNKDILDDITEEKITSWDNKSTFSGNYNDLTNKPTIPTVPTNISAFTNDKGYLTSVPSEYVTDSELNSKGYLTEHQSLEDYAKKSDLSSYATTSQLGDYAKKSELHSHSNKSVLDNITSEKVSEWNNKSTFSGNYNDLTNKPTIPTVPTNISAFTNDKGYLTSIPSEYVTDSELTTKGYVTTSQLGDYAKKSELHSHSNKSVLDNITSEKVSEWNNKSTFSGNYNDLTNKPTIPSIEGLATEGYVNNMLSGLRLIQMTQSEYDALEVKDSNTLYIII